MSRFIVLEGIDGAGTTTQTMRLTLALAARGVPCVATREPSTGPVGVLLRSFLSGAQPATDESTMGLLFAADRMDHLFREIEPALREGTVVVSDRYTPSSLAYQGSVADRVWIATLNARARLADLTIFLRVDPAVAAARRAAAGRSQELYDADETQRRVAQGYDGIFAAAEVTRSAIILDGHASPEDVERDILSAVLSRFPELERVT